MRGAVSPALIVLLLLLVMGTLGSCSAGNEQAASLPPETVSRPDRLEMVRAQIAARGVNDSRVLNAMRTELTDRVYTVEILPELARRAAGTLDRLGYARVQSRNADGWLRVRVARLGGHAAGGQAAVQDRRWGGDLDGAWPTSPR